MTSKLDRPLWRGRTNVDAFTISCIEHAEQIVRDRHPQIAHLFTVTQGSYQGDGGDPDSGTTHRLGGGVDLGWCGHWECYRALREAGMFIFHRTPDQGDWNDHFHGAPIGHPYMDYRLKAQELDYLNNGGDGLGGRDVGPKLNPIPRPVWPWPQEDEVTPEDIDKVADRVVAKLLGHDLDRGPEKLTVAQALRQSSNAPNVSRKLAAKLAEKLRKEGVQQDRIEAIVRELEAEDAEA